MRHDITAEQVRKHNPSGLIFSGGPNSVYDDGSPQPDPAIFDLDLPILGICYGMQLLCTSMGGQVVSTPSREYGPTQVSVTCRDSIFNEFPQKPRSGMSHGDQVMEAPAGFQPLASTGTCPIAGRQTRKPTVVRAAIPPRGDPHTPGQHVAQETFFTKSVIAPATGNGRFC